MPKIVTYLPVPDSVFVDPVEFSIIEAEASESDRLKWNEGYPTVFFEGIGQYKYIPRDINGKVYKVICGKRPVVDTEYVNDDEYWGLNNDMKGIGKTINGVPILEASQLVRPPFSVKPDGLPWTRFMDWLGINETYLREKLDAYVYEYGKPPEYIELPPYYFCGVPFRFSQDIREESKYDSI